MGVRITVQSRKITKVVTREPRICRWTVANGLTVINAKIFKRTTLWPEKIWSYKRKFFCLGCRSNSLIFAKHVKYCPRNFRLLIVQEGRCDKPNSLSYTWISLEWRRSNWTILPNSGLTGQFFYLKFLAFLHFCSRWWTRKDQAWNEHWARHRKIHPSIRPRNRKGKLCTARYDPGQKSNRGKPSRAEKFQG